MNNQRFVRTVAAGIIALVAINATIRVHGEDMVSQTARVTSVKGKARYSKDQKTWNNLKEGEVLKPGCLIQTATKAMVDINLGESGNAVRLFDDSILGIDKLDLDKSGTGNTQLDLRAGQIAGSVKKLSSNSKYEIKIESGVAAIQEGVYQISSAGELSVRQGSAVIAASSPDGTMTTKVVSAGQHFDSVTGKVTSISSAEAEKSSKNSHELKPMPKPVKPAQPQVRPGV